MWSIGPMDQIMAFLLISRRDIFEFRVNQELTKSHMDFSVLSLDSSSRKNMDLETKILSLSILDAE